MPRPSLVVAGQRRRRTTRASTPEAPRRSTSSDDDDDTPHFPRRWPRIGAAFQCKARGMVAPSSTTSTSSTATAVDYVSSRCLAPVPVSAEVPWRTVAELEAYQEETRRSEPTTTQADRNGEWDRTMDESDRRLGLDTTKDEASQPPVPAAAPMVAPDPWSQQHHSRHGDPGGPPHCAYAAPLLYHDDDDDDDDDSGNPTDTARAATETAAMVDRSLTVTTEATASLVDDNNDNSSSDSMAEWALDLRRWNDKRRAAQNAATAEANAAAPKGPPPRKSRYKKRPSPTPCHTANATLSTIPLPLKRPRRALGTDPTTTTTTHSAAADALSCLAAWTGGHGVRTLDRRARAIRRAMAAATTTTPTSDTPPPTTTTTMMTTALDWRTRVRHDTVVSVSGEYRSIHNRHHRNKRCRRAVLEPVATTTTPSSSSVSTAATPHWNGTAATLDATWEAVWACAQACYHQSKQPQSTKAPRLYLSTVWRFLQQAARLPPPSSTGPRDSLENTGSVVGDDDDQYLERLMDAVQRTRRQQAELLDLWGSRVDGVDLDAVRKVVAVAAGDSAGSSASYSNSNSSSNHNNNINNGGGGSHRNECLLRIDELDEMQRQLNVVADWQERVDATYSQCGAIEKDVDVTTEKAAAQKDDLVILQALQKEGRSHGLVTKGLVTLESKLERANSLIQRIHAWKTTLETEPDQKETVKFIGAMVREIHRLKIYTPVMYDLLQIHQFAEAWIERANIGIRSRISHDEIGTLLDRGRRMPVDLNEYLEKLQARADAAAEWLERFEAVIPRPLQSCWSAEHKETSHEHDRETLPTTDTASKTDQLEWLKRMRAALGDSTGDGSHGSFGQLYELATTGSRIPVEVDAVKLLHIELDARAWTAKTMKWVVLRNVHESDGDTQTSTNGTCVSSATVTATNSAKRAKLEDVREHVQKAMALRDRLVLPLAEKEAYVIVGESELVSIVKAADVWLKENHALLDGTSEEAYTLQSLKTICEKGGAIPVQFGPAMTRVAKIVNQAQTWYDTYRSILNHCTRKMNDGDIEFSDIEAAIQAAETDVLVHLKEELELCDMSQAIKSWMSLVAVALGSKRSSKGMPEMTINGVEALIVQARSLPVDTKEQVASLRHKIDLVRDWQGRASSDLDAIRVSFSHLREAINETYGLPSEYARERSERDRECEPTATDEPPSEGPVTISNTLDNAGSKAITCLAVKNLDTDPIVGVSVDQEVKTPESSTQCESTPASAPDLDVNALAHLGTGECNIQELVLDFCTASKVSCIVTPERKTAHSLQTVTWWCIKSLKYLESPRSVFDKRFFGEFDRFIQEGKALAEKSNAVDQEGEEDHAVSLDLLNHLSREWGGVVSDQLDRLQLLLVEREEYTQCCSEAVLLLNGEDRRPTLERINELATSSKKFPEGSELLMKVRSLAEEGQEWADRAREILSTKTKPTLQDATMFFRKGDKLGFTCPEMKTFRSELKAARSWSNRAKKCKADKGPDQQEKAKVLLEEHESLIVNVRDFTKALRQLMKGYCLCNRPYDGFMIGCDECDDWFHGPCVGISALKADKVSKFVCIRCSVLKTYKSSATLAANVVRKWTNAKDLKKARLAEGQKHKRKVRKEKKELERLQAQASALQQQLEHILKSELKLEKNSPTPTESHNVELMQHTGAAKASCTGGIEIGDGAMVTKPSENGSGEQLKALNAFTATGPVTSEDICLIPNVKSTSNPAVQSSQFSIDLEGERKSLTVSGTLEIATSKEIKTDHVATAGSDLTAIPVAQSSAPVGQIEAPQSKELIYTMVEGVATSIRRCMVRLGELSVAAEAHKKIEDSEDSHSAQLKKWVLRIRSLVLAPSTKKLARAARPNQSGPLSLSGVMLSIEEDAKQLGIHSVRDVAVVMKSFRCMAWGLHAIAILSKQPSTAELAAVIREAALVSLHDEKTVRTLKSIVNRATSWESKVMRFLTPVPGETKPFCLVQLQDLARSAEDIPVVMPLEHRLSTVIDDGGCRHCLCGGPSDGRFMLCCETCDRWFHGHCVRVNRNATEEQLKDWKCPQCSGFPVAILPIDIRLFHDKYDVDEETDADEDGTSITANRASKYWPPFGLFGTDESKEALGSACCSLPDCTGPINESVSSAPKSTKVFFPGSDIPSENQQELNGESKKVVHGTELIDGTTHEKSALQHKQVDAVSSSEIQQPELVKVNDVDGLDDAKDTNAREAASVFLGTPTTHRPIAHAIPTVFSETAALSKSPEVSADVGIVHITSNVAAAPRFLPLTSEVSLPVAPSQYKLALNHSNAMHHQDGAPSSMQIEDQLMDATR